MLKIEIKLCSSMHVYTHRSLQFKIEYTRTYNILEIININFKIYIKYQIYFLKDNYLWCQR